LGEEEFLFCFVVSKDILQHAQMDAGGTDHAERREMKMYDRGGVM
jgi:hypothetical protein